MTLYQAILSACLMFGHSKTLVKECKMTIKTECKADTGLTVDGCYKKIAPRINVAIKKQYSKSVVLQ
jgi:hypothetical protein